MKCTGYLFNESDLADEKPPEPKPPIIKPIEED